MSPRKLKWNTLFQLSLLFHYVFSCSQYFPFFNHPSISLQFLYLFSSLCPSTALPASPWAVGEYGLTERSNPSSLRWWEVNFGNCGSEICDCDSCQSLCAWMCVVGGVIALGLRVSVCVWKWTQGSVKSNFKWSSHHWEQQRLRKEIPLRKEVEQHRRKWRSSVQELLNSHCSLFSLFLFFLSHTHWTTFQLPKITIPITSIYDR